MVKITQLLLLMSLIICSVLFIFVSFDFEKNKDLNLCEEYAKLENVKITYPDKTIIINNETYSMEKIKEYCLLNN